MAGISTKPTLIPAARSGGTLDARQQRVTDKCHDTSWARPWLPSEVADQIGRARHLDDSMMRSVVPIQTPHGVLLKGCARRRKAASSAARHARHLMKIIRCSRSTNNMEMRLREAPKCTSHEHRQRASPAAQQSGAHGSPPPAARVTGGIVGRFFGAPKAAMHSTVNAKSKRRGFRPRRSTVTSDLLA